MASIVKHGTGTLPKIEIEIRQPGDRGAFVIKTIDATAQKEILRNILPENVSDVQYLYTARLLENRAEFVQVAGATDQSWKKADRYKDLVRYGQKLYADLFGSKGELQKYIKNAPHLKNGIQYVLRLRNTASELWNFPWEYLHDGEDFVVTNPNNNIVRIAPDIALDQKARAFDELDRPLRMLIVIADPRNAPPLNVDQEVQNILMALNPSIQAGLVTVDIIEEGSLSNLDMNLTYEQYHILHYTGHGAMSPEGSFLVLEGDDGEATPAFKENLLPIMRKSGALRLVVLSGCQTGQIEETQAMSGIATAMLEVVPAVVAMQFSILDTSAQIFSRTFFERVGQGHTLESAAHLARLAMHKANPAFADWGIPALYVNRLGITLVDHQPTGAPVKVPAPLKLDTLPRPPVFVGRRSEQRRLRQLLPHLGVTMTYIWGMGGIGKSALAARVLERPGRQGIVDSVLIIPCHETRPGEILERMAAWLAPQFPDAAAALRDPQLSPDKRIDAAARHVRGKRLVLVFDRFDTYMKEATQHHWDVAHPLLAAFFRAIATAQWSIMTIFTSRFRWLLLTELEGGSYEEFHLRSLAPHDIGMMLSSLKNIWEMKDERLFELFRQIGGHPATFHQLEAQAIKSRPQLVANLPQLANQLVKWWHNNFLADIVTSLSAAEQKTLICICVLDGPFRVNHVQIAADVPTREEAETMMAHWEACSLVNFLGADEDGDVVWYEIPELVRTAMLQGCTPNDLRELHRKAAKVIELDLVTFAEMRASESGEPLPAVQDSYTTARMQLRELVAQSSADFGAIVIGRVLDWRKHLIEIGDHARACDIVNDTWAAITYRYGEPELARKLIQETIDTTSGKAQTLMRSHMAEFLVAEGKLADALRIYEQCERELLKAKDEDNAAAIIAQQAAVYSRQGNTQKAIKTAERAQQLWKNLGDLGGVAQTLGQIGAYHVRSEKYQEAFKYILEAESICRKHSLWKELMPVLQNKGIVLKRMKKYDQAIGCYENAIAIAEQTGALDVIGGALSEIGDLLSIVGQPGNAARFILNSIAIAEQVGDNHALAHRLYTLSLIHAQQNNIAEAVTICERSLSLAKTANPQIAKLASQTLKRLR